MKLVNLDHFSREVTCVYRGETYRVRDNGAVLRRCRNSARLRPLDEKWTFGRANKQRGYMHVSSIPVHRIVATAFHGPQPSKDHVVDHIDTNRRNNRPENLHWVTKLDNILRNPITRRRVGIAYGSIENFVANPDRPILGQLAPSFEWMRSVTKREAEESYRRLLDWVKSKRMPSGGTLGEWVYRSPTEKHVEEPEPDDLIASRTPGVIQSWRVSSEFPSGPSENDTKALGEYRERPKNRDVFPRHNFGESKATSLASDKANRAASVNDFAQVKCKKCSSPLSRQYLHVIPSSCWKCGSAMKIALIDQEKAIVGPREFSDDHVIIATEGGALLKENYSRTMEERYLSNTCPNCKSMTGDFYLHHHYNPELRETGVPAGAICWSCKQREDQTKQSTDHITVSVEVAPGVRVEVDPRPTPAVGDVENGE